MKLHTFGDCHSEDPWMMIKESDIPKFEELSYNGICPHTMSYFGMKKTELLDISGFYMRLRQKASRFAFRYEKWALLEYPYKEYFNVNDGDVVIFCFGEPDCREHLPQNENWKELIDEIVPNYFKAIESNVEKFNHLYTMVFNVIPPPRDIDFQTYGKQYINKWNNEEIRKSIVHYMNEQLKKYCEEYNYGFFDIYDKYCDTDGFLNHKFTDKCSHITNPIYYIEFINNLKIHNI